MILCGTVGLRVASGQQERAISPAAKAYLEKALDVIQKNSMPHHS